MCNCYCVLIIQYSHGMLLLLCVNYTVQSRCVTVIVCVLIIQYSHGVLLLLCVNYTAQSRCVTVIKC